MTVLRRRSRTGQTRPRVFCFDCDKSTASTQDAKRVTYSNGSSSYVLVCRWGTGCHKGQTRAATFEGATR